MCRGEHTCSGEHTCGSDLAGGTANVRRMLELSTANLPPCFGGRELSGVPGVFAWKTGYGWLMWVPDDPPGSAREETAVPPESLAVQVYARGRGCDYVLFDGDAAPDPALPHWEWER